MKKYSKSILALLFISLLLGCGGSSSLEEDFEGINKAVAEKYVKRLEVKDLKYPSNTHTLSIGYDGNNKVSSLTKSDAYETSSTFLNYDSNGKLIFASVGSSGDVYNMSEFYQAPYEAFDKGDVLTFDTNGNPKKIQVTDNGVVLTGDISYHTNPSPFFYTLKAAGILEVLDNVQLSFGLTNSTLIKARKLVPYNNITSMIFKDSAGKTHTEIQFDYVYDEDKYPKSARMFVLSGTNAYTLDINYYYK